MFHVGKLAVQQVEILVQPAGSPPLTSAREDFCSSSLIFMKDILSVREILVDSGASVLVFPGPKSSSVNRVHLLTADGSPIIPLQFSCGSDSKVYTWTFQLAPVSVPLLGADFLQHSNLLVDIKNCRVVHADCPEDVVIYPSPGPQPAFKSVSFLSAPQQVQKLLEEFPDVLFSNRFTASKPRHGVCHHLLTNPGPQVFAKPSRLDRRNYLLLKLSSPRWRKLGLFGDPPLPGHLLFIW